MEAGILPLVIAFAASLDDSSQTSFVDLYDRALRDSAQRARLWIPAGCLPLLCNALVGSYSWLALRAIDSAFVAAPELTAWAVRATRNGIANLKTVASRCWEHHTCGMAKALLHKLYAVEVVASLRTVEVDPPSEKSWLLRPRLIEAS
jgi:hypothetical protein